MYDAREWSRDEESREIQECCRRRRLRRGVAWKILRGKAQRESANNHHFVTGAEREDQGCSVGLKIVSLTSAFFSDVSASSAAGGSPKSGSENSAFAVSVVALATSGFGAVDAAVAVSWAWLTPPAPLSFRVLSSPRGLPLPEEGRL